MKANALAPKIIFLILLKLILLFCLWKLFFSSPLAHQARIDGVRAGYFALSNNAGELNGQ